MTPAPVGLRCPEHSGKPQGIQKVTTPPGGRDRGRIAARERGHHRADRDQRRGLSRRARGGRQRQRHRQLDLRARRALRSGVFSSAARRWASRTASGGACSPPRSCTTARSTSRMNMYSLYFAGTLLEQVIGRWRFLAPLHRVRASPARRARSWLDAERRVPSAPRARSSGSSARCSCSSAAGTSRPADRSRADRVQPRLHVRGLGHLGRRAHRRSGRRHRR